MNKIFEIQLTEEKIEVINYLKTISTDIFIPFYLINRTSLKRQNYLSVFAKKPNINSENSDENSYAVKLYNGITRLLYKKFIIDIILINNKNDILKYIDFNIESLLFDPVNEEIIDICDRNPDFEISKLGFLVEKKVYLHNAVKSVKFNILYNIQIPSDITNQVKKSPESIKSLEPALDAHEFIQLLTLSRPSVLLEKLQEFGLLRLFIPELSLGDGMSQNIYHKFDIFHHSIYACDAAPVDDFIVRTAALFHDIGKAETREENPETGDIVFYNHELVSASMTRRILSRMLFPKEIIKKVSKLVRFHMFHYNEIWTDSAVRRLIRKVGSDNLPQLFKLREADRIGNGNKGPFSWKIQKLKERMKQIQEVDSRFSIKDLAVSGDDLIHDFNLKPGPVFGDILKFLFNLVKEDLSRNNRDYLFNEIKNYLEKNNEDKKRT